MDLAQKNLFEVSFKMIESDAAMLQVYYRTCSPEEI